jgi:sucrose-6-phosphate hydrolase SacC (GH32 family)
MMVVRDGDTYYMFAEGAGDRAQLLTSTDRVHWQPKGTLDVRKSDGKPIPPGPFGTPTAWREDGTWHLFYERMDRGIWHATSKDLAVFTHVSDEPILRPGPEAWDARAIAMNQVLKVGDLYVASYHGLGNEGPNRWSHGLAISKDLRVWRKGAKNPFFPPEVNKSSGVYVPTDRGWLLFTMHDRVERHVLGQMPQENIQQSNP